MIPISLSTVTRAGLLGVALGLSACANGQWPWGSGDAEGAQSMSTTPQPGYVSDMEGFAAFIEGKPTPEQFRTRHPDVHLVMPGDITTKELRFNNSRFFAEFDDSGRVIGGRFQ